MDGQSANVNYDNGKVRLWESKSGTQDLYHVSATSNVDTIIIRIPGRDKPITLSREQILKAKAASETKTAAPASPETAPSATPGVTTSTPPETIKAAEHNSSIEEDAKKLERLTTARSGLYNSPAVKEYKAQLNALLEKHPTLKGRGDLVKAMGPEKLGLNLHEVAEFGEKVFNQIASPLTSKQLSDLKAAVVNLSAEYDKYWGRSSKLIEKSFKDIENLGQDAKPLVETYWSLLRNNETYIGNEIMAPPTFEAAKKNLTGKPEAAPAAAASDVNPQVQKAIDSLTIQEPERVHAYSSRSLKDFQAAVEALKQLRDTKELPQLVNNPALEAVLKAVPNQYQRESLINAALNPESLKDLEMVGKQAGQWWVDKKKELLEIQTRYKEDPIFKAEMDFGWDLKYRHFRKLSFAEQLAHSTGNP